ncbi:acyltransferase family protein [Qipengyuania vesicularis]|uniref:acyltransferase family protein n=1 Tax=Qipengyuania vesicularis TaxID=2867232 RepID=UPI001C889F17|nr:acyltransferase [Qipengyuania vesicularis]
MAISYRPEIDGMRAVAVVSVLIYHLRMPSPDSYILPGGFLGVDVFFVLSGFLITSIVAKEIAASGRIDFSGFYLRRARRILPPLFLVLFASIPVAYAVLLPSEMQSFANSLWAALGFYSNFFWYFELGEYGSQSGLLQPFLHTWSLAIEEQFYLVWPILLLLLMRFARNRIVLVTVGLLVASLALAQLSTFWRGDFSFFSTASRAWELLAGAVLALSTRDFRAMADKSILLRYAPSLGLAAVIVSMVFLKVESPYHPGLATIPTILGTCMMIAFANPRDPATRLMAAGPSVWIGKLSYSLYLWHFPIFAFGRLYFIEPADWIDWTVWIALTFALSWLGYRLVEKPLRFKLATKPFLTLLASATVLAIALPFGLKQIDMDKAPMAARLAPIYGANDYDNQRLDRESWEVIDAVPGGTIGKTEAHSPSPNELGGLWFSPDARLKVLVVGNSHGKDMFNALYLNRERFEGVEFARFGLGGHFGADQVAQLVASPNYKAANVIAIAPLWAGVAERHLEVIRQFLADGKQVVLIDNTAKFDQPSQLPILDYEARLTGEMPDTDEFNRRAFKVQEANVAQENREIAELGRRAGVPVYSRYRLVCDDALGSCSQLTPAGKKTVYDYGHWTVDGARLFGERAADAGWFSEFLSAGDSAD